MEDNTKDINPNSSNSEDKDNKKKPVSEGRRDAIKALATVPVLGAMAYGVYKKGKVRSDIMLRRRCSASNRM